MAQLHGGAIYCFRATLAASLAVGRLLRTRMDRLKHGEDARSRVLIETDDYLVTLPEGGFNLAGRTIATTDPNHFGGGNPGLRSFFHNQLLALPISRVAEAGQDIFFCDFESATADSECCRPPRTLS